MGCALPAQTVLETEPKCFRNFYLFDNSPEKARRLKTLPSEHSNRPIQVHEDDSNGHGHGFRVLLKALVTRA